ncbi:MAG: hypothetical protein QM656_00085 [Paracoccaceae bacterium]
MTTTGNRPLFDRLAVLHRPDCAAMTAPATPAPDLPDAGMLARILGADEAGRYAIAARQVYEELRRLIGQLAGLLILARLTSRRDHADLAEHRTCRDRHAEAVALLARLSAPGPLGPHRARLAESTALCGEIIDGLARWQPDAATADAEFAALNARIRHALGLLESCSSDKAGLQMVDFSHACCTCGGH